VKKKILLSAVLSISFCWADAPLVKQMLESALADSENAAATAADPADPRFDDALEALTPSDLESLLPTAMQCLRSTHLRAQKAGLITVMAATFTPASSALLEPYLDNFNAILSDSTNPIRQGLIATLALSRPSMSPKAIQLFLGHLEDKTNTAEQTGMIGVGLLHSAPSNQAIVHQVLSLAEKRSEYDVKAPLLQEIGLSKIQLPEALDFIGKELDDPSLRSNAMTAASRLDRDVRARFAGQLSLIAQDPDEPPDIRAQARATIGGH
jgi:hypothetical protein